jgi:hypothetical protein
LEGRVLGDSNKAKRGFNSSNVGRKKKGKYKRFKEHGEELANNRVRVGPNGGIRMTSRFLL